MSQANIDKYFDMLGGQFLQNPCWKKRPYLIFNLDETCLQCDKTDAKVYMNVYRRNAYKIVADGTKQSFTLIVCCNAAGQILPPYTLYKAKALDIAWMQDGVEGAGYGVSDSGWMFDQL